MVGPRDHARGRDRHGYFQSVLDKGHGGGSSVRASRQDRHGRHLIAIQFGRGPGSHGFPGVEKDVRGPRVPLAAIAVCDRDGRGARSVILADHGGRDGDGPVPGRDQSVIPEIRHGRRYVGQSPGDGAVAVGTKGRETTHELRVAPVDDQVTRSALVDLGETVGHETPQRRIHRQHAAVQHVSDLRAHCPVDPAPSSGPDLVDIIEGIRQGIVGCLRRVHERPVGYFEWTRDARTILDVGGS